MSRKPACRRCRSTALPTRPRCPATKTRADRSSSPSVTRPNSFPRFAPRLRSDREEPESSRRGDDKVTKTALITGITGQDGSYLAEFLLGKGYEIHGIVRRSSSFNTERLDAIYQDPHVVDRRLFLHFGDLSDAVTLVNLLRDVQPHEVYNLGAQSHVRVSFDQPVFTGDVTGLAVTRL